MVVIWRDMFMHFRILQLWITASSEWDRKQWYSPTTTEFPRTANWCFGRPAAGMAGRPPHLPTCWQQWNLSIDHNDNKSEINIDNKGIKNAYDFCFENNDPANKAMAICGANPIGLPGMTLYKALTAIMITKATITCLFNFITICL